MAATDAPMPAPPLTGRDDELARAVDALGTAPQGAVLLVHGPAGIGKTRLVTEALAATDTGAAILASRSHPLDTPLAFAALADALSHYLDELAEVDRAELLADLGALAPLLDGYGLLRAEAEAVAVEPALRQTRRLHALQRLMARIAAPDGAVLVIDDAHWADSSTLDAIAHLARSLSRLRLGLVLTFRGAEVGPKLTHTLAHLRRTDLATEIPLRPLSDADTSALATTVLGGRVDRALTQLLERRTTGVPLFVTALLGRLRQVGAVEQRDGRWAVREGGAREVPEVARDLLLSRAAGLTDLDRQVLDVLAVAGHATLPSRVARVLEISEDAVEVAVDRLVGVGLAAVDVERTLARARVDHPLVGEAAYAVVPPLARRRLHSRLAADLAADDPVDIGRLARHCAHAGDAIAADMARDVLADAGRRALSAGLIDEAIEHLQAAIDRTPDGTPDCAALLELLGHAWMLRTEPETAAVVLAEAERAYLAAGDDVGAAVVHGTMATSAYFEGDHTTARQLLAEALGSARDATADSRLADLYGRQAHLALSIQATDELAAAATAADALADRDGDRRSRDVATLASAWRAQVEGDFAAARDHARRVLERDSAFEPLTVVPRAHAVLTQVAAGWGDRATLQRHSDAIEQAINSWAPAPLRWRPCLATTHLEILAGNVNAARAAQQRAVAVTTASPAVDGMPMFEGWIAWGFEDIAALDRLLADGFERSATRWDDAAHDLVVARAVLSGRPDDARDALARPASGHGFSPPFNHYVRGLAWAALGERDAATAAARRLSAMGPEGTAVAVFATLVETALQRAHAPSEALATAERAVEDATALGLSSLTAWAARHAAEAARDADDEASVRRFAEQGRQMAARGGLRRTTDATRRLLREVGVRAQADASRGTGILTARQREIAELVAAGLSNAEIAERLFVSVRTVTTHLDHIYTRLGLSSRAALATWLAEARLADGGR